MSLHSPGASHALVALQFASIGVCAIPFEHEAGRMAWLAVSLLGGLLGIYVLMHNRLGNFAVYPEPLETARLVTSGPYRWIRHPMYTSLLLFMAGIVIYNNALWNYLAFLTLCLAVLGKMQREERYLLEKFEHYAAYRQDTHRLIPKVY